MKICSFISIGIFGAVYLLCISQVHAHEGMIQRVVAEGKWSDPNTWDLGHVPHTREHVVIKPGHTIIYDVQSDELIHGVRIEGELYFSRSKDTRLKVNNSIMVHKGGNLDIGTLNDYIPRTVKAEIIFVLFWYHYYYILENKYKN